ncbi:hypothetical protein NLA06_02185 [Desulfomicrobium sp. ZS1]|uniref:hypothetical protein n=1 Tax=Desulfomicrobium sp. ZS1 TaxID=2952228 RepID=UPI0020B2CFAB|nr:hypothetical protein [Desulfomicrobium sp. ZS1]UTF50719.1 hypothetical protein NLA06_02185 [Desulfomicrobium sp. ZS1]
MNNLLISIGDVSANHLFVKHAKTSRYPEYIFKFGNLSVVLNSQKTIISDDKLLFYSGVPLPTPVAIPSSWDNAVKEFSSYEGIFNIFYLDKSSRKFVVCTDFLGFQPLYWMTEGSNIYFSSHTKFFESDFDPVGWGSFLSLGYTIGNSTLTSNVKRVPPASIIVIDLDSKKLLTQQYWSFSSINNKQSINFLFESLVDSVDKAISAANSEHFLLMSGGFDSRLIACMLKRRSCPFRGVIVSHYDENFDADARLAKALASQLSIPYDFYTPEKDYFSSKAYLDYLFDSDSEIASLYLFISQVAQYVPQGTVWDGIIPGGSLKGNKGGFQIYFSSRMKKYEDPIWDAARQVFAKGVAEQMWESFQDALHNEVFDYSDDSEGVTLFNFQNRMRNRIAPNPFKIFQKNAQILTLGATKDYINCAMGFNYQEKGAHKLYFELLSRYIPEALKLPFAHGFNLVRSKKHNYLFDILFAASNVVNFLRRHPRLVGLLGLNFNKNFFTDSSFINFDKDDFKNDSMLNYQFVTKLMQGDVISPIAMHIFFYWRIWRMIHQGNFLRSFDNFLHNE